MDNQSQNIETHPWPPFIPKGAKLLIMGTFPPGPHRWSMDFYYPNRTNDFWYIMGLILCNDRDALLMPGDKQKFNLPAIKQLLTEHHIALHDTCRRIRRLKGNASDKYLEIIEPVPLQELLAEMPDCRAIATTGEKAAKVIATLTDTPVPHMGECVMTESGLQIWRMPSTSRAYPLPLGEKANHYARLFRAAGILPPDDRPQHTPD